MAEQGRILSTSLYKAAASGIGTVLSRLTGDVRAIVYDHLEFEDLLDVTMVSQGLRDTRGDVSHIHSVRLHKFHDAGVFQRLARCKYVHAIGRFPDDLALLETPLSAMNGVLTVVCSLLSRDPQYGVPNSLGWAGGCRALAETHVLRALERLEFFQIDDWAPCTWRKRKSAWRLPLRRARYASVGYAGLLQQMRPTSALHSAIFSPTYLKELLLAGVDQGVEVDGVTPIVRALVAGAPAVTIQLLLAVGADVNQEAKCPWTCSRVPLLELAISCRSEPDTLRLLIAHGGDPRPGVSAFEQALKLGDVSIVKLFLGTDATAARASDPATVFGLAWKDCQRREKMVLLLEHGFPLPTFSDGKNYLHEILMDWFAHDNPQGNFRAEGKFRAGDMRDIVQALIEHHPSLAAAMWMQENMGREETPLATMLRCYAAWAQYRDVEGDNYHILQTASVLSAHESTYRHGRND